MPTIQDVARHAEVSVSNVSNVLNGRADWMCPETLARVEGGRATALRIAASATRSTGILFESLDRTGFPARLPIDEDGFVPHYPGLFSRVALPASPEFGLALDDA